MDFLMCITVGGGDGNTSNSNENNLHYLALTVFQIIILLGPNYNVQSICHCVGFQKPHGIVENMFDSSTSWYQFHKGNII